MLALMYTRITNVGVHHSIPFVVKDIEQAIKLADAIAESDLLSETIDANGFDLCEYKDGKAGESWESEDGEDFNEYWRNQEDK